MRRDAIPENFKTLEEFDEFWSRHSLADYEDLLTDVEFTVSIDEEVIAIAPALAQQLRAQAHEQGMSVEALVNRLLRERL
ncbi:MAG: hypothetical protein HYR71_06940 [Chloroflexi bacterium]|nr:hypothetical protein [Chloroflexota bacterium]